MTRQQIRQFLALVDTGSFSRAAEAVGVAQPTLSSGIRALEDQVGARLFDRQRPAVRLTSAGNRLLPIARRIAREFQRAETEAAQVTPVDEPFVLGILPSLDTAWLQESLSGMEDFPLTVRERDAASLRRELRQGALDAAITVFQVGEFEGLEFTPLYEEDFCLMLPQDHRLADRAAIAAEELADEVMIARRSCEKLGETSRFFTARGVRPRFSFKSHSDDRAMAMVAAGLGLTVAPRSLSRSGIRATGLIDFGISRQVGLAARTDDYRSSQDYRESCVRLQSGFAAKKEPVSRA